jgi:transcriptional regulator with XRE-family HTH domain
MVTYDYDISKLVRRRKELGLTDLAIAKAAELSPATVGHVLRRGRSAYPHTIGKIARALGIDLADLVVEVGPDQHGPTRTNTDGVNESDLSPLTSHLSPAKGGDA